MDRADSREETPLHLLRVLVPQMLSGTGRYLAARLWIGRKIFRAYGQFVVRISRDRVIKGPCELSELEALEYVSKHTSIPVPRVLRTYHIKSKLFIEMEFIQGNNLEEAWLGGYLSTQQKEDVTRQLAGIIEQLRGLKPPQEEIVGSVGLGECLDHRIGSSPIGPFSNHREFHSFLRRHIPLEDCTKVFGEDVTLCHSHQYHSIFSHADLSPRNILVAGNKITAIVDWQFAGWWPEYWEYTKAHFGRKDMSEWYDKLGLIMTRYDEELVAERALWKQCDQPGMPQQPFDESK